MQLALQLAIYGSLLLMHLDWWLLLMIRATAVASNTAIDSYRGHY